MNQIRDQLDRALDRWWALGELPPRKLLRDGLLMLEAGGAASESQRSLLLRAALAYGRGTQTALRHQRDPERVALILAEALVEWEMPIEAVRLPDFLAEWAGVQQLLVAELQRSRVLLSGVARQRAEAALALLARQPTPPPLPSMADRPSATASWRQRSLRQLLFVLLVVTFVAFVLWQRRQSAPANMVALPAASYALLPAEVGGQPSSVPLGAFLIDRFEVTNWQYRRCVESGQCAWPLEVNSATRRDYFTNPAFDSFPVVNVTQATAAAYCAAQEKRLPSAAEWQVAASVSPITGQAFPYPWGMTFDAQRTNSLEGGRRDSVVVGSFRPGGDAPSGAADMAGNVAEWTATLVSGDEGGERAVIKGGSFADGAPSLMVGAEMRLAPSEASPQVGFRCARTHLLAESP
jgi:formylglycine-generating enzyme required for sulfatase activity